MLDPVAPRRGRSRPERLGALAALAEPDAGDALEKLVAAAGVVALAPFAWARNLPLPEIETLAEAAGLARFGAGEAAIAVSPERLMQLGERIAALLADWHRAQPDALGPTRGALFARLRGQAPEPALDAALTALIGDGGVVRDGGVLRLPSHQPRLNREDERLWERVRPLLAADGLRPPRVRELASELDIEPEKLTRFFRRVERFGRVAPVAANRYFLPETVRELAELAARTRDEIAGRQLHGRGVQGPLRHRAQSDHRGARISRPCRRDTARRRRPRDCARPRRAVRLNHNTGRACSKRVFRRGIQPGWLQPPFGRRSTNSVGVKVCTVSPSWFSVVMRSLTRPWPGATARTVFPEPRSRRATRRRGARP